MSTLSDRVNMLVVGLLRDQYGIYHRTATILAHECDFLKNSLRILTMLVKNFSLLSAVQFHPMRRREAVPFQSSLVQN